MLLRKMRKSKTVKGKVVGVFGSISGTGSIISAHNVCHMLCLAVVALLSVFGIMVSSNVLMFLEEYNLLFWSMGIFFLALSLFLYFKFRGCISKKLILVNVGLLTIGVPFFQSVISWIVGGVITGGGVFWYVKDRFTSR